MSDTSQYEQQAMAQEMTTSPAQQCDPTFQLCSEPTTNTTSTGFLTYDNATLGFIIQYPSDWQVFKEPTATDVRFISPFQNESDRYTEILHVFVFNSGDRPMQLNEWANNATNVFAQTLNDFQLISVNPTILAGYPAQRIEYTYSDPIIGIANGMIIGTIQDETWLYTVSFFAKPSEYATVLPIAQRMIDSLQLYE